MTSYRDLLSQARAEIDEIDARGAAPSLDDGTVFLDVRERSEWDERRIPGSIHVPYHDLRGLPDALEPDRPIAAVCASGQRSALAASLLQRAGAGHVIHVVDGGVGTWAAAGWPVEP